MKHGSKKQSSGWDWNQPRAFVGDRKKVPELPKRDTTYSPPRVRPPGHSRQTQVIAQALIKCAVEKVEIAFGSLPV